MTVDPKIEKKLSRANAETTFECTWNDKPAAIGFSRDSLLVVSAGIGKEVSAPYSASRIVGRLDTSRRIQCYGMYTDVTFETDQAAASFDNEFADRKGQGLGGVAPNEQLPPPLPVLVVTTNDVAGHRIEVVHGDVIGLTVRARNAFSNLGASMRTVVGGEVGGYTKLLRESRLEARGRMVEEARRCEANAVVAMRYDCNEIGDVMSEIVCYGTAVTIRKVSAAASSGDVSLSGKTETGDR